MQYHLSLDIEFRKNPYKGMYIALEGIDGSGKTTQVRALADYFSKLGRNVTITSEPKVDLEGGEDIMRYFRGEVSIPGLAFQYWMTANRVINHKSIVIPALKNGDIVLTDRCMWSAVPYGLMDMSVSFERKRADLLLLTQGILSPFHQFIAPDRIFFIDISPGTGLKRSIAKKVRKAENDVYEKKEKLEKVRSGYHFLLKEFPDAFMRIHGEKPIDEITQDLIEQIRTYTA